MDMATSSCSLTQWLDTGTGEEEEEDSFDAKVKAKARFVLSVISGQRSEADHVILDNHLYQFSYVIYGNSEARDLGLKIAEVVSDSSDLEHVTFKVKLPSSTGCSIKFLATDGTVLLAQVQYSTFGRPKSHLTCLLNMQSGHVLELSRDVPEVVDCVVRPGWCMYRTDDQPSLATLLDFKTGASIMLELTPYKEWPTSLTLDPRPYHSHVIIYVTSTGEPWKTGAEGYLTQYDVQSRRMLCLNDNILLSSDILQYSPGGHSIIALTKYPSSVVLFSPDSLQQQTTINYPKYCPFLDLPLKFPPALDAILSCDTVQRLPAAKVAIRQEALDPVGLRLRGEAAVLLWPVAGRGAGRVGVVHLNLGQPLELSEVHMYSLDIT